MIALMAKCFLKKDHSPKLTSQTKLAKFVEKWLSLPDFQVLPIESRRSRVLLSGATQHLWGSPLLQGL